jgi:hypothetical protein
MDAWSEADRSKRKCWEFERSVEESAAQVPLVSRQKVYRDNPNGRDRRKYLLVNPLED